MSTYLDFRCSCGAIASFLSALTGALACSEHKVKAGHPWVLMSGMDRDLYRHELEVVLEHAESATAIYRLVPPGGGVAQSVRLAFLGGQIAIYGDLAPGPMRHDNRGVLSRPLDPASAVWFASAYYDGMVAKFLDKRWISTCASEHCLRLAGDVEHDEAPLKQELQDLADDASSIDDDDDEEIAAWCRRLVDATDDSEAVEGCLGYDFKNEAVLRAIQLRFGILWRARANDAAGA